MSTTCPVYPGKKHSPLMFYPLGGDKPMIKCIGCGQTLVVRDDTKREPQNANK